MPYSATERLSQPASAKITQQALSINTSNQSLESDKGKGIETPSPSSEEGSTTQPLRETAQRTFSDPLPSALPNTLTSSTSTPTSAHPHSGRSASVPQQPKSAGHAPFKTLRFAMKGKGEEEDKDRDSAVSPTMRSPATRAEMGRPMRRHSHEPRVNVYTQCGRHSDDWLFGGFSVSGTMKRIWEKKE